MPEIVLVQREIGYHVGPPRPAATERDVLRIVSTRHRSQARPQRASDKRQSRDRSRRCNCATSNRKRGSHARHVAAHRSLRAADGAAGRRYCRAVAAPAAAACSARPQASTFHSGPPNFFSHAMIASTSPASARLVNSTSRHIAKSITSRGVFVEGEVAGFALDRGRFG